MGTLLEFLSLLNAATPAVTNLIVAIRHKDGTVTQTAVTILDEADAQFATNQKQIADWIASHPAAGK